MKRWIARVVAGFAVVASFPAYGIWSASEAGAANPVSVQSFGTAPRSSFPASAPKAGYVAIAADAGRGRGYWALTADGSVFTIGNSQFHGAPNSIPFTGFATDMVSTPSGNGYWITTTHGAVYDYGDARWRGAARDENLGKPVIGIAVTTTGRGYWLVTSAGRVFAYGDADHHGNAASIYLPPNIVDIAASPSGNGYSLLDSRGYIYAFGDAYKPTRTQAVTQPAIAISTSKSGRGYLVLDTNGDVVRYGDANHLGDAGGTPVNAVDLATTRQGTGYWIATVSRFDPVPANSGTGRRIVYSNGQQRIWLIEANGLVSNSFLVSGRTGAPPFGTYYIASKSAMSSSGSLALPYMSRFYKARSGKWIGFHGIPLRPDGTPIQTDAQLGQPLSAGCIRMNQQDVKVVWDFTPIGTKIVVVA